MIKKINFHNGSLFFLMALSATIVFFQAQRVLPLVDYTYQLENAYRIYIGQTLYKDFILVVAPGTYVVMAFLMKIFGLSNTYQLIYVMIISSFTILLSYKIISRITNNSIVSIILSASLIFCGYSIYPFPSYDNNTMFFILLSLNTLLFTLEKKSVFWLIISGILLIIPPFFKQNTGLIYTFLSLFSLFILAIFKPNIINKKHFAYLLLGVFLVSGSFLFWLFYNNIFNDFIFQNFIFPSQSRPLYSSIKGIISQFITINTAILYFLSAILWLILKFKIKNIDFNNYKIILFVIAAFIIRMLTSNFPYISYTKSFNVWYDVSILLGIIYLFEFSKISKTASYLFLLPIVIIGVSYSSFLSQGVLGSSYGIWPLFFIMLAFIYKYLIEYYGSFDWLKPIIILTFLISICLGVGVYKNNRLRFVSINGDMQKASRTNFEFIATPGNWINEMEVLFAYIDKNIPINESMISIPAEDPIFFATKRDPVLKYFQLNIVTCPFSEKQIINDIKVNNIKWIIWKTKPQMPLGYFDIENKNIKSFVRQDYKLVKVLKGYEIYQK